MPDQFLCNPLHRERPKPANYSNFRLGAIQSDPPPDGWGGRQLWYIQLKTAVTLLCHSPKTFAISEF